MLLRRIYDWCIGAAGKPHAAWIMGALSFGESSILPIPPDVMMIPMSLARPDKTWFYATLCTATSVAGGMIGYLIGAALYDTVGHWIILLKGLTPIPYKIVTITSGFADYPIVPFLLLSVVARGIRFYFFAFLLHRYGVWARVNIEKRLGLWFTIGCIVVLIGVIAATKLF